MRPSGLATRRLEGPRLGARHKIRRYPIDRSGCVGADRSSLNPTRMKSDSFVLTRMCNYLLLFQASKKLFLELVALIRGSQAYHFLNSV